MKNNVPNIIECKDLIYFTCMQSYNCFSYNEANTLMFNEKRTDVTTSAYIHQRTRRSYKLQKHIYESLLHYSNILDTQCSDSKTGEKMFYENLVSVDGAKYSVSKNMKNDGLKSNQTGKTCSISIRSTLFKNLCWQNTYSHRLRY